MTHPSDVETYGRDAVEFVRRQAADAVDPALRHLQAENHQLRAHISARDIYSVLDAEIPNWREINTSGAFLDWLASQHVYADRPMRDLLTDAFQRGDSARVLQFFRGFLAAAGGARPAQRSRASSAARNDQGPPSAAEWAAHYEKSRRHGYKDDAARDAAERSLHARAHGYRKPS
jgi:hypothetical protein